MPILDNPRHERFCQELAAGKTGDDAYEIAGFKRNRHSAFKLKQKSHIKQRLSELLEARDKMHVKATEKATERLSIDREWVLSRLMENADRALQKVAVLDSEGKPTGEFRYNGNVANRALELLGKEIGMFIDRHEIGEPGEFARMSDDELQACLVEKFKAFGCDIVPARNAPDPGAPPKQRRLN